MTRNAEISRSRYIVYVLAAFIAALLLLCVNSAAQAESDSVAVSKYGGSVYVRAFVPGEDTKFGSIGHFDLMIKGTVYFRGRVFVNPVFSYRQEDSRLDVFNESDTGFVYPHSSTRDYYYDCDIYQRAYRLGDKTTVENFLKAMDSCIASSGTHPNTPSGIKCRIKSGNPFAKYKMSSINCFCAVATWLKGFGDSSLMNYYVAAHQGKCSVYYPKTIAHKYDFYLKYRS